MQQTLHLHKIEKIEMGDVLQLAIKKRRDISNDYNDYEKKMYMNRAQNGTKQTEPSVGKDKGL